MDRAQLRDARGSVFVEYILLVALALLVAGAVGMFGSDVTTVAADDAVNVAGLGL